LPLPPHWRLTPHSKIDKNQPTDGDLPVA
jgi:hypothetical protein